MRIATVESATLATVGYDEGQELLQLEFGSRAVYLSSTRFLRSASFRAASGSTRAVSSAR